MGQCFATLPAPPPFPPFNHTPPFPPSFHPESLEEIRQDIHTALRWHLKSLTHLLPGHVSSFFLLLLLLLFPSPVGARFHVFHWKTSFFRCWYFYPRPSRSESCLNLFTSFLLRLLFIPPFFTAVVPPPLLFLTFNSHFPASMDPLLAFDILAFCFKHFKCHKGACESCHYRLLLADPWISMWRQLVCLCSREALGFVVALTKCSQTVTHERCCLFSWGEHVTLLMLLVPSSSSSFIK